MATLTTLRRAVISKIGLTSTAAEIDETLVDEWLNQGVVDVLLQTRCNVNCADLTTTANEWKYTLPTSILSLLDLTYQASSSSTTSALERTTPAEILRLRQQGATNSTPSYYALAGNDLLMLYPTPSSVDTIELLYVPRPAAMAATADSPSAETYGGIPSEYHKAIECYALWQAGDYSDDASSNIGSEYRRTYLELIREFKRAIRKKGGRSLGRVRVNGRSLAQSDNSQDIGAW